MKLAACFKAGQKNIYLLKSVHTGCGAGGSLPPDVKHDADPSFPCITEAAYEPRKKCVVNKLPI